MSENKKTDRRRDLSDIIGAADAPLSEEFFEEKLRDMEDAHRVTRGGRMKHRKPATDARSLSDAEVVKKDLVFRDPRMQKIFGADDTELSEEFFEEKLKDLESKEKAAPPKPVTEYEQWLEEGLKKDKGYGDKVSYEGDISEEKDSYKGSTYEQYDKWQAETQEMIRRLKTRDAAIKARDDSINDALYVGSVLTGGSSAQYAGDTQRFLGMILGMVWYAITAAAMAGLFFAFGIRGNDLLIPAGIGGVVGAIIRHNGKDGYTVSEAIQLGAAEVGIFVASIIMWIVSLFSEPPFTVTLLVAGIFGCVGIYVREKHIMVRPTKEAVEKALPLFGFCLVTAIIVALVAGILGL